MLPALKSSRGRYKGFLQHYKAARTPRGQPERAASSGEARLQPELWRRPGTLARYRAWLAPHRRALAILLGLAVIGICIDLSWPVTAAYLIDRVVLNPAMPVNEKFRLLAYSGIALSALFVINSGVSWLKAVRLQLYNAKLGFDLRSGLLHHVLRLPLSELSDLKVGGVLSRLSGDVDSTAMLLQTGLINPALAVFRLLCVLGIVLTLDHRIALAVISVLPLLLFVQLTQAGRIRPIWRSIAQDRQDIDARVGEGVGGVRIVRAFRRERGETRAYALGHHTVLRKQLLATNVERSAASVWELMWPLCMTMMVCYGGYLIVQGEATIGVVVAFQGYLNRLFEPILHIANSINETQRGLASIERVFDVLDKPRERPDRPDAVFAPATVDEIRFEAVSFAYRPGIDVIKDFELSVPGGSVIALTGPSGSGKTTLTDLVARFQDPTNGSIRVNGIDVRQIKLQSYRKLIGIVPQETFLFDGSVRDNIAYARPSASLDEIETAAIRANAIEFIANLPEGFDTLIGERGVKLSGGQRQRLSIARALLADPKILILDEATSNLDSENELLIQASLQELLKNRTTFVIAHRLSTVVNADKILVLDKGRLVEAGNHRELLQQRGVYFAMFERQRRGADADAHSSLDEGPNSSDAKAARIALS